MSIKEYTTFKLILDDNSEMITVNKHKIKACDCKVLSVLFEDAMRQKAISKIKDDNYIFIRRAVDVKAKVELENRAREKALMGSEVAAHVDNIKTSSEFEQKTTEARKLNKHVVSKLIHAHTKRLLKIIGY